MKQELGLKKIAYQQLATGQSARELGMSALRTLIAGASHHFTKPLLVAEVRHILPTAVGLPMEISLYTAAVAAASVNGRCKVMQFISNELYLHSSLINNITSILAS